LQALLRERGRLSPRETVRIAEQIGGALDAAHRAGLVHRDVKPANILVADLGDHTYLCDFGLAKRTGSQGVTQTGFFLGTVDYCAPEQIQGQAVDGRADIYSLGGVLFHCLAGDAPYVRETDFAVLRAHLADPPPPVSSVRPNLPRALDDVIVTALAKYPDARFGTAGALATAFKDAVMGSAALTHGDTTRVAPTVPAPPPGGAPTAALAQPEKTSVARGARNLSRRLRWLTAAVILVAVLGAAATVVATRAWRSGSSGAGTAEVRMFVDRIENVLEQSAASRQEIGAALAAGLNCSIPPREAGQRIAATADDRQRILVQLGSLPTPTEQAGDIVNLLQQALARSIEADRHYRDGFFSVVKPKTGCPLPPNSNFKLAQVSDARASAAKERFVSAFDPLAVGFHRRIWAASEF
jgi:hypothetical protein